MMNGDVNNCTLEGRVISQHPRSQPRDRETIADMLEYDDMTPEDDTLHKQKIIRMLNPSQRKMFLPELQS